MGAGLEEQHHRKPGWLVQSAHPPPLANPDVGVVGRLAGEALVGVLALAWWLDVDGIVEFLDPHGAFEWKCRPRREGRQGEGPLRHEATIADGPSLVVPPNGGCIACRKPKVGANLGGPPR